MGVRVCDSDTVLVSSPENLGVANFDLKTGSVHPAPRLRSVLDAFFYARPGVNLR